MGLATLLFKIEITPEGIRGIHELKLFSFTFFRLDYYQHRWENSIITKYFGWPIWGIAVQNKDSFASNGLISSLYIHNYKQASRVLYEFAKNKAYLIDNETISYLERLPPLIKSIEDL